MAKSKTNRKRTPKHVLKLPDLEQSKSAVLNSLTSPSSQRTYDHAIREFIQWYCSEPRLAFNKTVANCCSGVSSPGRGSTVSFTAPEQTQPRRPCASEPSFAQSRRRPEIHWAAPATFGCWQAEQPQRARRVKWKERVSSWLLNKVDMQPGRNPRTPAAAYSAEEHYFGLLPDFTVALPVVLPVPRSTDPDPCPST